MEQASLDRFKRPFVVVSDLVCLLEFDHTTCASNFDLELHRGEWSDVGSSASSDSGHLDNVDFTISHDDVSEVPKQIGMTTFNSDGDVNGGLLRDPMLGCDEQGQDLCDFHSPNESYVGLAKIAANILFNWRALTGGEVVDAESGFAEAGTDKDPLAIKVEGVVGPGRHYHQLGISDDILGDDGEEASDTHPNMEHMNVPWRCPEESTSEVRKVIQRAERSGLLQDANTGSPLQGIKTVLHHTRSAPGSAPFMAAVSKLKAVISISLAKMHKAEPAATTILMAAVDEVGLAAISMLLAAINEEELASHFNATQLKSPPMEAYWRASPSPSSTTRHTRLDEFPKGVIQRLMPRGRTIYFGMDMDSFTSARIDRDVTDCLRQAAIEAAKDIREQNLGIAFAYTTDPRDRVFNICYDPSLPFDTLARGFFPSDRPDRWKLCVSSLASARWVFEYNRAHIPKIFGHEFAHILGLRHCNAGSDASELRERSFLWPGTCDGVQSSIMMTGVESSDLKFSDEDIRVIRDFYSKRNGALVGNVRVMDVDPYKKLWDFFLLQFDHLDRLNRPRRE